MGQALGLLEGIVTWIRALVSPEPQLAAVAIAREAERVNRAAAALEHAIARGAYAGRLDAAQIVLGTALGLVETQLPVWEWRERRSALSNWYDAIAARASFRMTEPPDGESRRAESRYRPPASPTTSANTTAVVQGEPRESAGAINRQPFHPQ